MSSQVSALISRFKIGYPACSSAFALTLFNDAALSMVISTELSLQTITVSLIQGQREYVLGGNNILIKEAYWVRSASPGDSQVLYQTSDDWLAENRTGWRSFSWMGQSWNCYVGTAQASNATEPATLSTVAPGSTMVLGFDPPPNVTTIGGYPCVQIYATQFTPYLSTDYVPDHLGPDEMWIDKMNKLYTKVHSLGEVGARVQLADASHQETVARVKNTELQSQTVIMPGFVQRRRRI